LQAWLPGVDKAVEADTATNDAGSQAVSLCSRCHAHPVVQEEMCAVCAGEPATCSRCHRLVDSSCGVFCHRCGWEDEKCKRCGMRPVIGDADMCAECQDAMPVCGQCGVRPASENGFCAECQPRGVFQCVVCGDNTVDVRGAACRECSSSVRAVRIGGGYDLLRNCSPERTARETRRSNSPYRSMPASVRESSPGQYVHGAPASASPPESFAVGAFTPRRHQALPPIYATGSGGWSPPELKLYRVLRPGSAGRPSIGTPRRQQSAAAAVSAAAGEVEVEGETR